MAYARDVAEGIPRRHAAAHSLAQEALGEAELACDDAGKECADIRDRMSPARVTCVVTLHAFPAVFLAVRWWHTGIVGVGLVATPSETGPMAGQAWRVLFWLTSIVSVVRNAAAASPDSAILGALFWLCVGQPPMCSSVVGPFEKEFKLT